MRRLRVLLDTNVLVDAQLRDLFCRLAEVELIELFWSARILADVQRVLTDRLRLSAPKVDRLVRLVTRAFPDAAVTGYEHRLDALVLPDPDDRHVLAAAAEAECDLLVTFNLDDFPQSAAEPFDLFALDPDEALMLLSSQFKDDISIIVNSQIAALKHPPISINDFLDRLSRHAPQATMTIGAALGVERYRRMFYETLDAQHADSPQSVVRSLIDAVTRGDSAATLACLTPELRDRIMSETDSPEDAADHIVDQLADVISSAGWGFATARRIAGPNTEYVRLVRAGSKPVVANSPQLAQGHSFKVVYGEDGWLITEIDSTDPAVTETIE